jgi:hypothetical protein
MQEFKLKQEKLREEAEKMRNEALIKEKAAIKIQAAFRGFSCR